MNKKFTFLPLLLSFALVLACSKEPADNTPVVEYNMENQEVANFIDKVYASPYTVSDFTASYIKNYYQKPKADGYRGDCPASLQIEWTPEPAAVSYSLVISERKDLSDPERTVSLDKTISSYSITNLIPGRSYYCSVKADVSAGEPVEVYFKKIKVTGRRRMIALESAGNFRDLGGLRTESGRHVRYGKIFRGARCSAQGITLSENDKKELHRIGIKADLDLRQYEKSKLGPDEYNRGKSPIGDDIDWKLFERANESYFKKLLDNDEYIKALQWTIDELRADKPVYFHCKSGADRTGTFGWLIESLLGVTEVDKSIDFEITSFFYDFGDPKEYTLRSRNVDNNSNKNYDWGGMYNLIDKNFKGANISEKVYRYFLNGVEKEGNFTIIKRENLDWFIDYMLE